MKSISLFKSFLLVVCLCVAGSAMAQDQNANHSDSRRMQTQVVSGQKMKVEGMVVRRENGGFIMRNSAGSELKVDVSGSTRIEEKKSNPFRGAKRYSADQIYRGLYVEVEGRGDQSGSLVADRVRFTSDAQRIAESIDTTVAPVENRMGQAESRMAQDEQNAQKLAGQIDELSQVANLAKGGAAAAQQTADAAVEGVNRTNDRISSLDDYQEKTSATVNFRVNSAVLSEDAKAKLDDLANQAKSEHGFVIEVRGFASSDGGENYNNRLSERRADAVVRYLAQHDEVPLRRIILPFGYGAAQPVADNSTRDGRIQNRRVEVKVLVSRGLTNPVNVTSPNPTTTGASSSSSSEMQQ